MMKKFKNISTVLLFGTLLFSLAVFAWVKAPQGYSKTERRTLAQLPRFGVEELISGNFMSGFESYAADQFPMRDGWRSFKAVCVKYLFGQKDNNGLYSVNGYLSKLEYPLNPSRLEAAVSKINAIEEKYLSGAGCNIYLSLIPDKNCFLAPLGGYPYINFETVEESFVNGISQGSYIDIYDLLSLEDYYCTDQHWRQECISGVADKISLEMTGSSLNSDFEEKTLDTPFYGAYVGQSALPAKPDTVKYLTNGILEGCTVYDYSTGAAAESSIYRPDKADGRDPYEFFLNGSTPLCVIENPACGTGRELVVFRDSFGSSLVPLLVENYSKITVVDLRYIRSDILGRYIDFENRDILFIYSTLILNNIISM